MQINTDQYKQKALKYAQRLNDVRFTGQIVFTIIVLLITWSGIKSIQTNYALQKQISTLQQQNELQQLQNSNLALQDEYLNSNQYLELSARQSFGLGAPGEKEIIVPASVARSYTTNMVLPHKKVVILEQQPAYQKNFESWVDFFLHRQNEN
jgi:cell division protein FtsB